jgi:AraC family transcriptional activator of pobA
MTLELKTKEKETIMLFGVMGNYQFPDDILRDYHTHMFCHRGSAAFLFNGKQFTCKGGEFVFWFAESQLANLTFSKNYKATVLLVEKNFLNENIPSQNWSIDAMLHSKEHPVLQLNDTKEKVLFIFQLLYDKFGDKDHRFYAEALKLQMQMFLLDMWHIFAAEYESRKRSLQSGTLYEQFLHLVQAHCMKEREVQYYANQLSITPKYLNYVCKQNSGVSVSEWIQRYTKERIVLLLQNKNLNIAEIAEKLEFSSRSFFTRYVKKVLGVTPSAYRNRLG